jgi:hypothetical protein
LSFLSALPIHNDLKNQLLQAQRIAVKHKKTAADSVAATDSVISTNLLISHLQINLRNSLLPPS